MWLFGGVLGPAVAGLFDLVVYVLRLPGRLVMSSGHDKIRAQFSVIKECRGVSWQSGRVDQFYTCRVLISEP